MNFYKRYIGDYARDTAHLSLTEHGVYAVLLDTCYATEKPLPGPMPELYRICRAATAPERRAVDRVAEQFFPVGEDGWRRNPRVEVELSNAAAYAHAQSKRAHVRWHGSGNASASARHMPDGMQAQCPDDASHSHSHSHSKPKSTALSGSTPDASQLSPPRPDGKGNGAYSEEAEQVLDYLNRATGHSFHFRNPKGGKVSPNGQVIIARLAEGYTAEQLREVVHLKALEWRSDEKMVKFLRPQTLFGAQKFAQYVGELESA